MQLAQSVTRLDPQLLDQEAACRLVRVERLRLSARAVQREHELRSQSLTERVRPRQGLQIGNRLGVTPEREPRIGHVLQAREPELFQPGALQLEDILVWKVGEGCPAPQPQGLLERVERVLRVAVGQAVASVFDQAGEAIGVDLLVADVEAVAAPDRLETVVGAQRPPEARDVRLERLRRSRWRVAGVDLFDQHVCRHDLATPDEQDREQRLHARTTELHRSALSHDLKSSQDPKLHRCPPRPRSLQRVTAERPTRA